MTWENLVPMESKLDYWERRYNNSTDITAASEILEPSLVNQRAKQKFAWIVISIFDELSIDLERARILAAGCGAGAVSEELASRCAALHGFDFSGKAIQELKATDPDGEYLIASASNIPFCGQFDVVTGFSLLYHIIDDDEWRTAIEEFANKTRQGGYLFLRINWSQEPLGEQSPESHFYERSRRAYRTEFERNSLSLIDVIDLPVKPMGLEKVSAIPGGQVLKAAIAPVIVAADLYKKHENKLVILQKES